MLNRRSRAVLLAAVLLLVAVLGGGRLCQAASRWAGWRGDGSGSSAQTVLPTHWDAQNGIAWKTRLAGEGNSSPIVWQDRVFVTASTEGGLTRLVICLDSGAGRVIWQTPIKAEPTSTYPRSGYAAPTPVTDGKRVYAFFDSPGMVALDYEGNVVWQVALGPFNNPYNMASSPVLSGDNVVIKCDHSGPSFIVALDRVTGKEAWRTGRAIASKSTNWPWRTKNEG